MFVALTLLTFAAALALDAAHRTGWPTTALMVTGLVSLLLWAAFPGWPPRRPRWR
jgi:hypothetical protein